MAAGLAAEQQMLRWLQGQSLPLLLLLLLGQGKVVQHWLHAAAAAAPRSTLASWQHVSQPAAAAAAAAAAVCRSSSWLTQCYPWYGRETWLIMSSSCSLSWG
jgi:aminoglycoside phosphotransferase